MNELRGFFRGIKCCFFHPLVWILVAQAQTGMNSCGTIGGRRFWGKLQVRGVTCQLGPKIAICNKCSSRASANLGWTHGKNKQPNLFRVALIRPATDGNAEAASLCLLWPQLESSPGHHSIPSTQDLALFLPPSTSQTSQ